MKTHKIISSPRSSKSMLLLFFSRHGVRTACWHLKSYQEANTKKMKSYGDFWCKKTKQNKTIVLSSAMRASSGASSHGMQSRLAHTFPKKVRCWTIRWAFSVFPDPLSPLMTMHWQKIKSREGFNELPHRNNTHTGLWFSVEHCPLYPFILQWTAVLFWESGLSLQGGNVALSDGTIVHWFLWVV